MPLRAHVVEQFGGLRLDLDPLEVGINRAVDLENISFNEVGRIQTRWGHDNLVAVPLTNPRGLATFSNSSIKTVVIGFDLHNPNRTDHIEAYNVQTGTFLDAVTSPGNSIISGQALYGTGSSAVLYLSNHFTGDTIWKWNGTSFSSPAGMPKASFLAVMPRSERLVAIHTTPDKNRVQFSNVGNPEVWGSDDFVDLEFGGGEISAAAQWRELVFVFKTSPVFYVFYGESTDDTGGAIFEYRPINGWSAWSAVAGEEGVYFFDGSAVWLTTGGEPTRISRPIEPFLRGEVMLAGKTPDPTQYFDTQLGYALGELYVTIWTGSTAADKVTLVYNPKVDAWSFYTLGISFPRQFIPDRFSLNSVPEIVFASPNGIELMSSQYTTDDGTTIPWSYTSGYTDFGSTGEKFIRFIDLDGEGSGSATITVTPHGSRTGDVADSGIGVQLSSPMVRRRRTGGVRGRFFSHKIDGLGPATIHRLEYLYQGPFRNA